MPHMLTDYYFVADAQSNDQQDIDILKEYIRWLENELTSARIENGSRPKSEEENCSEKAKVLKLLKSLLFSSLLVFLPEPVVQSIRGSDCGSEGYGV
jgi:hypothetical protein